MSRQIIDTTTNNGAYIGDPAVVAFGKVNDNFLELYSGAGSYSGFIAGLRLSYVSPTQIGIGSGAAFIPAAGKLVVVPADITVSIAGIASGTMYHVYLRSDTGQGEISTVAPAAPYIGSARLKTGDATRRYLGSFATGSTAALLPFYHFENSIRFRYPSGAPYRVLSTGTALSATAVSLAAVVPAVASAAMVKLNNYLTVAGSAQVFNVGATSDSFQFAIQPDGGASLAFAEVALSPGSTSLYYFYNSAPPVNGGGFIDVLGYVLER